MTKMILVVDKDGNPEDDYKLIKVQEGESIDDAVMGFLEKAREMGWGNWIDIDETNNVASCTFHFKVVETEAPDGEKVSELLVEQPA